MPQSSESVNKQLKETRSLYLQGKQEYDDGSFDVASRHFLEVAERQEALLGKYHKETVKTYWRLGKCCCRSGEESQALEAFQRAARMAGASLDESTTALLKEDIESCWREAFPQNDTAIEQLYQIFHAEQQGDAQCKKRNFRGAIERYTRALDIQAALMGNDSLDAADIRLKLGCCYLRVSSLADAEEALQASHACYVRRVGDEHPATYGASASMRKLRTQSGRSLGMSGMKGWVSASLSSLGTTRSRTSAAGRA